MFMTACHTVSFQCPPSSSDLSTAYLLGFSPSHARLDLSQYLANVQDAVDEDAVGGSLDLEVAEECVGAEEGKDLV